jgi:hypothetical protein
LANIQYISPIRLFEHFSISYDGEINIARIKKQLIAEFDFAKNGFIETRDYTYNKNDVLKEIEKDNFQHRLQYHKKIWANKNILGFLEKNTVNLETLTIDFSTFLSDKDFDSFLSPYFAAPFNYISRNLLNEKKLEDMSALLTYGYFLLPAEREEAFKSIRIFLNKNMRFLKNISKENYKSFRPKIQHWIITGWADFLNNLPDEFYSQKIDFATDLVNLTVKLQKTNKKDCISISKGLIQLKYLTPNLRETVIKNNKIYHSNQQKSNYRWLIWGGIILLKILATGGCH